MMEIPIVSIIVAAYNSQRSIDRCIRALLAQRYQNFEIIVVDNNSSDSTAARVKRYPVRYMRETKKGWPAARNAAIAAAKTCYVANIDADCFATPDWLAGLMQGFSHPSIGAVVGRTRVESGRTMAQRYYAASDPFNFEKKIGKTLFIPWGGGNNAMLRDAFIQAGGYDSDRFVSGADVEFHHRMAANFGFKTVYQPDALIYHEARGSMREFFNVAAKYSHDGFLRSRSPSMQGQHSYDSFFMARNMGYVFRNAFGLGYRTCRLFMGKETRFRVMANWFELSSLSGTIYGYLKAQMKSLRNRKTKSSKSGSNSI